MTRPPESPVTVTPAPPRPYRLQIMADADLMKWVESKRGKGRKRLSVSETGYLLLCHLRDTERGATPPPPVAPDRRQGGRRTGDQCPDAIAA